MSPLVRSFSMLNARASHVRGSVRAPAQSAIANARLPPRGGMAERETSARVPPCPSISISHHISLLAYFAWRWRGVVGSRPYVLCTPPAGLLTRGDARGATPSPACIPFFASVPTDYALSTVVLVNRTVNHCQSTERGNGMVKLFPRCSLPGSRGPRNPRIAHPACPCAVRAVRPYRTHGSRVVKYVKTPLPGLPLQNRTAEHAIL